ncbi:MAG: 2,3-bisphosphoglycerate-independent phosphoglycerate mutase [Candidatus Schekmanbacteria bacterium]|nr:2,3-bisphosphoglycerate-independent phosphoglycerate mutase [Candidatus Schekmanbacteria bacterium]
MIGKRFHAAVLLILDGIGDHPNPTLGNRTPLQVARTPAMDDLARRGRNGLARPGGGAGAPNTAAGTLSVLGYDPDRYPIGRGSMEARGAGLTMAPGDVAFRCNWASVSDDWRIVDCRAGRIDTGREELLEAIRTLRPDPDVAVDLALCTGHRLALVLRGPGLSDRVLGSDPRQVGSQEMRLTPRPISPQDPAARRTAQVIDRFERMAAERLRGHPVNEWRRRRGLPPANALLSRGAGTNRPLPQVSACGKPLSGLEIGADRTVAGLCLLAGMRVLSDASMTGTIDTDLDAKFALALKYSHDFDLIVLHIKGCDISAHDRRAVQKAQFIERIDVALGCFLDRAGEALRIGIASDHGTSSITGDHLAGPVPVLAAGPGIPADGVTAFDEVSATRGDLGMSEMTGFMATLFACDPVPATAGAAAL